MKEASLSIGDLAGRAGVRTSAIRYYESVGLIPEPARVSGQRRYEEADVQRLGVIAVAKEAGFTLEEIRTLLDSADRGEPAHQELRILAKRKLPEVDALIERAQAVRQWLSTATSCGCDSIEACRLFATLGGGGSRDTPDLEVVRGSTSPRAARLT